ncbi:MAG: TIGR00159 family protein [Chloroflexi bacterium]|nr:MAG: TIGR00159 family protein [Chloroflexota bacterium]
MLDSLEIFLLDTRFRLLALDGLGWLDLALVTAVFLALILFIRRSRAGFLLRGGLLMGILSLIITIFLPLPTFDWLVRGVFLLLLVAMPVVLQPELRRWLERVGRTTGLTRTIRQTAAESILPRLLRTVENLSASHTGAIIVLEGDVSLQKMVDTGIPINGRISAELLQTIFFNKTPLHDGAVIMQGEHLAAAGCVLPLTEQKLTSYRRLGTRHRAAVGVSEVSDALVIVVSEETGNISISFRGQLTQKLESAVLRQRILDFYEEKQNGTTSHTFWDTFKQSIASWRQNVTNIGWQSGLQSVAWLLVAAFVSLAVWTFVIEQTNPTERPQIDRIALRVENMPAGLTLMTKPPETVSVVVQTTSDVLPTLNNGSFQAVLSLQDLGAGLHQPQVQIKTGITPLRIISVNPPNLDLELAATTQVTMPVTVDITDPTNLSAAYQVVGVPTAIPNQVKISGPEPLVARVSKIHTSLALGNASATIREIRPLRALDENGQEVTGVTLEPAQTQITLIITRRQNAREVGIQPMTTGTLPDGYWLSSLRVTPTTVTLRGNAEELAQLGGFVDTLPVDISQTIGLQTIQVPLDLPPGVEAVDQAGTVMPVATVEVQAMPRSGDLVQTRTVTLFGQQVGVSYLANPAEIDLLLSGPLPVLWEIENNPDLVQVMIDVSKIRPGAAQELEVQIVLPNNVQAQLIPATIRVTLVEE